MLRGAGAAPLRLWRMDAPLLLQRLDPRRRRRKAVRRRSLATAFFRAREGRTCRSRSGPATLQPRRRRLWHDDPQSQTSHNAYYVTNRTRRPARRSAVAAGGTTTLRELRKDILDRRLVRQDVEHPAPLESRADDLLVERRCHVDAAVGHAVVFRRG